MGPQLDAGALVERPLCALGGLADRNGPEALTRYWSSGDPTALRTTEGATWVTLRVLGRAEVAAARAEAGTPATIGQVIQDELREAAEEARKEGRRWAAKSLDPADRATLSAWRKRPLPDPPSADGSGAADDSELEELREAEGALLEARLEAAGERAARRARHRYLAALEPEERSALEEALRHRQRLEEAFVRRALVRVDGWDGQGEVTEWLARHPEGRAMREEVALLVQRLALMSPLGKV